MTNKKKGRALAWVSAGIVFAAMVAGGIGIIIAQSAAPTPDRGTAGTSSSTAPGLAPEQTGECDVPGGDITAVPSDLTWDAAQGVSWPVSPSLGPVSEKDGFPVCFSHSPVGAALAAHTVYFETLRHEPADVTRFYLIESPGKEVAVEDTAQRTSDDQLGAFRDYGLTAAGFRVDEYTGDRALVYIVLATPEGRTGYRGMPLTLEWVDGDWRVKALDTGQAGQPIDVLDGQFTAWTN